MAVGGGFSLQLEIKRETGKVTGDGWVKELSVCTMKSLRSKMGVLQEKESQPDI